MHHSIVDDAPHNTVGPAVSDEFVEHVHAPHGHIGAVLLIRDEPNSVTLDRDWQRASAGVIE